MLHISSPGFYLFIYLVLWSKCKLVLNCLVCAYGHFQQQRKYSFDQIRQCKLFLAFISYLLPCDKSAVSVYLKLGHLIYRTKQTKYLHTGCCRDTVIFDWSDAL